MFSWVEHIKQQMDCKLWHEALKQFQCGRTENAEWRRQGRNKTSTDHDYFVHAQSSR